MANTTLRPSSFEVKIGIARRRRRWLYRRWRSRRHGACYQLPLGSSPIGRDILVILGVGFHAAPQLDFAAMSVSRQCIAGELLVNYKMPVLRPPRLHLLPQAHMNATLHRLHGQRRTSGHRCHSGMLQQYRTARRSGRQLGRTIRHYGIRSALFVPA